MTLNELAEVSKSKIKVLSAYDGKILCRCFDKDKDSQKIGKREVVAIWSEMSVMKSEFGNFASSFIGAYVDGHQEAEEASRKQK